MQPFRDFLQEDVGYPVVTIVHTPGSPPLVLDDECKSEINAELAEITEVPYSWPLAGYEAIKNTLSEYYLNLPDIYGDLQDGTGELVFCIEGTDLYLYIFHDPTEDGRTEFYAEIVNESELHDVLDDIDVGESDEESTEEENDDRPFVTDDD
jgi:hypothetical protein